MLQSGHRRRDRRTDGWTDGPTDRRTEWNQYSPPKKSLLGGYNNWVPQSTGWLNLWQPEWLTHYGLVMPYGARNLVQCLFRYLMAWCHRASWSSLAKVIILTSNTSLSEPIKTQYLVKVSGNWSEYICKGLSLWNIVSTKNTAFNFFVHISIS